MQNDTAMHGEPHLTRFPSPVTFPAVAPYKISVKQKASPLRYSDRCTTCFVGRFLNSHAPNHEILCNFFSERHGQNNKNPKIPISSSISSGSTLKNRYEMEGLSSVILAFMYNMLCWLIFKIIMHQIAKFFTSFTPSVTVKIIKIPIATMPPKWPVCIHIVAFLIKSWSIAWDEWEG